MANMTEIGFAGGAYQMPDLQIDSQTCINWYVVTDQLGKYKASLRARPRLSLFADDSIHTTVRGILAVNDTIYIVADDTFYICKADRNKIEKGKLNTSSGIVDIISNDYQILINDGTYGYVYQVIATQYRDADIFFPILSSDSDIATPVFVGTGLNDMTVAGTYTATTERPYVIQIDSIGASDTFKWSDDGGVTWLGINVGISAGTDQPLSNGVTIKFTAATGHALNSKWTFTVRPHIETPVFVGSGVNDLTDSGTYTGSSDLIYRVQIDGTGTPNTFRWSSDNGVSWIATGIPITAGSNQSLNNGVYIKFTSATGHVLNAYWIIRTYLVNAGTITFTGTSLNDLTAFGEYNGDSSIIYRVEIDSAGTPNTFKWSKNAGVTWTKTGIVITGQSQLIEDGLYISFLSTTSHTINSYWDISIDVTSSYYAPPRATYQDGVGFYPRPNTQRFYISEIDDFSRVNALDYAQTNVYADNLIVMVSLHQEIYAIGVDTIELWYNTGNSTFNFDRRSNFVINYGTEAPFTVQVAPNNVLYLLSNNKNGGRSIISIENYTVKTISTEPLNEELRSYVTVSDAFSYIIDYNNHTFIVYTFPSANKTWVYDSSTSLWAQWASLVDNEFPNPIAETNGMFRGSCYTVFEGRSIVGDYYSGKIFELTSDSQADPAYNNDLMLQISRDGGMSWGSELWIKAGAIGNNKYRALWGPLGTAREFTFRLRVYDQLYRDFDKPIAFERITPHLFSQDNFISINQLRIDVQCGTGKGGVTILGAEAEIEGSN